MSYEHLYEHCSAGYISKYHNLRIKFAGLKDISGEYLISSNISSRTAHHIFPHSNTVLVSHWSWVSLSSAITQCVE